MKVHTLVELVNPQSVIEDQKFENAVLVGPAVLAVLNDVTIDHCIFDGTPESMFIEVEENRIVQGIVAIRNSTFRNCRFQNVAFIGTKGTIDLFRKDLAGATQTEPQSAQEQPGVVPQG